MCEMITSQRAGVANGVGIAAGAFRISNQPALVEALLALVVFRLTTPPTHRHFSSALGQRDNGKSLDPRGC
jgi:hypothetical protein